MKQLFRFIIFIFSSLIRTIPFIIFLLTHVFWSIYTYKLDPLKLLDLRVIPTLFGDYIWIYIALGILVFAFLTLNLHFLAYLTFIGAFLGQNIYFLRAWENTIYKLGYPNLLYRWFFFIYFGLAIGFVLQSIFTGGNKVLKIRKYNKLRRTNQRLQEQDARNFKK